MTASHAFTDLCSGCDAPHTHGHFCPACDEVRDAYAWDGVDHDRISETHRRVLASCERIDEARFAPRMRRAA